MSSLFPKQLLEAVLKQASEEYPKECCGLILGPIGKDKFSRIQPVCNLQDDYHAKDPEQFPRTSKDAYWMDPIHLLKIQKETRAKNEEIKIIYHSHIDTGAYFSAEDKQAAIYDGLPVYPSVRYLVVSIHGGCFQKANLFAWKSESKDFVLLEEVKVL